MDVSEDALCIDEYFLSYRNFFDCLCSAFLGIIVYLSYLPYVVNRVFVSSPEYPVKSDFEISGYLGSANNFVDLFRIGIL
jgi:hypothetical protein